MYRGKVRDEWDRTAELWALLANAHRDPEKRHKPFTPGDIHPWRSPDDYKEKATPEKVAQSWEMLKGMFHKGE